MSDELQDMFDQLCSPFPTEEIAWRVGATNAKRNGGKATKGVPLCYIDARAVMDRLDRVAGFENWQDRYSHAGQKTVCEIGIRIDSEWVWKSDGAGDTDMEADKGALSDAFKRAAVRWGIGRYLYDLKAPWVDLGEYKNIPDDTLKKLNELHDKVAQNQLWGDRNHQNLYRTLLATIQQFVAGDQVDSFIDQNKGQLAQLPVNLKRQLWQELERIKDGYQAVAAE